MITFIEASFAFVGISRYIAFENVFPFLLFSRF